MKREDLEEWLDTKWLGRNLQMMEETDSTNQRAKTAAATGEQEGLVIVAGQQTGGAGRSGRRSSRRVVGAGGDVAGFPLREKISI